MLSSQRLPVPTTSLIDYNLVRDLGLKMEDLQCSKFTFGGSKFRILGKISQTVQTIKNGVVSGTAHLRASVVENLSATFDSHSIAGKRMTDFLGKKMSNMSTTSAAESRPQTPASQRSTGLQPSPSPSPSAITALDVTPTPPPSAVTLTPPSAVTKSPRKKPSSITSPKLLNHHYATTYSRPQGKKYRPNPHIPVRTLAVSPDDQHSYGRVTAVYNSTEETCEVEIFYKKGNNKNGLLCTIQPLSVGKDLDFNDLVLFKMYEGREEAEIDGHYDVFPILMVYNDEEKEQLHSLGIPLPDVPPDLHPAGHYS